MTTPAMPRKSKHWSAALEVLGACEDDIAWARTQPSLAAAWKTCARADWMLWLLDREPTRADHQRLTLIGCECARTVLHLVPPGEDRPRLAIEAAEAWAANPSAASAAASAAWAARAASDAAWAAANAAALKDYCQIVRRYFPNPPKLEASRGQAGPTSVMAAP